MLWWPWRDTQDLNIDVKFHGKFHDFPPSCTIWRQILCLRLHPMAQKGHQRLNYWCQISWKNIHDLSPSISCLRLFTGREIWRQISCLRLSLGHKICLEYVGPCYKKHYNSFKVVRGDLLLIIKLFTIWLWPLRRNGKMLRYFNCPLMFYLVIIVYNTSMEER